MFEVGNILQAVHLHPVYIVYIVELFHSRACNILDALASDICETLIKLHGTMNFTFMQLLGKLLV
jgi:hypothetical protein